MGNQPVQPTWVNPSGALVIADKGTRVVGYLIDVLPPIILTPFGLIPIAGAMIIGVCLAPYWLLRDVTGNSLGKIVLKTRVVMGNGEEASVGARIIRNIPLAIGPAFLIIPILGYVLAPSISFIVILIEGIMTLTQGERLGDRLAGTAVVKKIG